MTIAPVRNRAEVKRAKEIMAGGPQLTVTLNPQSEAGENLYLIGRPTLKQFLRFVKDNAIHAPSSGDPSVTFPPVLR